MSADPITEPNTSPKSLEPHAPHSPSRGEPARAATAPSAQPLVELRDIHKRFGDLEVLKGVSLSAASHEVVALIGASGSGKSTLLRCTNLLEIPEAGRVTIEGQEVAWRSRRGRRVPADAAAVTRMRTRLAMVFQNFNLWDHLTILQNVMEAPLRVLHQPRAEVRERALAYLEQVGIVDKATAYPAQLSGGQQQRAAIARALTMEPRVMLFDEPTSALDPETEGEVLQVMLQLAQEGRSMIIVTHDMDFAARVSHRTFFLHNGQIEEEGRSRDLFTQPRSERLQRFLAAYFKPRVTAHHSQPNP